MEEEHCQWMDFLKFAHTLKGTGISPSEKRYDELDELQEKFRVLWDEAGKAHDKVTMQRGTFWLLATYHNYLKKVWGTDTLDDVVLNKEAVLIHYYFFLGYLCGKGLQKECDEFIRSFDSLMLKWQKEESR